MATMARWGKKTFEVSTKKVNPIESFSTSAEKKASDSKSKKKKPSIELEEVSFSYVCHANAGVDPEEEYYSWRSLIGQKNPLYIHGRKWWSNNLKLEKVSLGSVKQDDKGRMRIGTISLSFIEENKKQSARPSRSTASKSDKKKKKK
ncbi:MAG: hypothetical protein MRZ45_09175 [Blautia sp.]|nr:hypothetical protein [Blautia sp.]